MINAAILVGCRERKTKDGLVKLGQDEATKVHGWYGFL